MKTIWIITKRELNSFFDSLIAIIMIVLFLGFSGFFTWISGSDIFLIRTGQPAVILWHCILDPLLFHSCSYNEDAG